MKLSTRSQYGLLIMLNLGLQAEGSPLQLSEIASRERISEKYLGQIVMPLRASGLVSSLRGAQGGYLPARKPHEITVLDIVEAIEGEISIVDTTANPSASPGATAAARVWDQVSAGIRDKLSGFTIADLLEFYRKDAALLDFSI